MDRVKAAEVFLEVVRSGSFTATANRLDMSRAMVTRYIETMETWFQVRLLHRTTRKVTLTTAGENCLTEVERWVAMANQLSDNYLEDTELSGRIRVATSVSFGSTQLVPAIKGFIQLYPKVNIDIELEDSASDMVENQLDLAIRIASNPAPSLIGKPIAICDSVLVASPEYQKGKPPLKHPDDLVNYEGIAHKNFQARTWHLSNGKAHQTVNMHCRLSSNETFALLHATLNGFGISMLPTYLVNDYIRRGELIEVLPGWRPDSLKIYALYLSRSHLSPVVRVLIDYLSDYFAKEQW